MKNAKFGVFDLGLATAVVIAVTSVSAQSRVEPRSRPGRNVMVLDGRGSQLGVMVSDVDVKAATGGVRIDDVNADSPAEKAGIKAGDVVVEFDGERVRSARQFTRLVQETPEGRSVAIGLMRDGKKQTVNATPENGRTAQNFGPDVDRAMRDAERGMREFRFDVPNFDFHFDDRDLPRGAPRRFEYRLPGGMLPFTSGTRGRLGVSVQSLTPDLQEYFGATNGGALVSSVTRESAAAKAGVKAGDVITSINGTRVADSDDLVRQLDNLTGEATIVVLRDKKETTLKVTLERRDTTPRAGSRPAI